MIKTTEVNLHEVVLKTRLNPWTQTETRSREMVEIPYAQSFRGPATCWAKNIVILQTQ